MRSTSCLLLLGLLACSSPVVPAPIPRPVATLEDHVRFLTESDPPRNWQHPLALMAVADYIAEHFEAAGARVEHQDFEVRGQTYRNVRGFFGPAQGERLVVGAHYDAFDELPGADDNASGVAVLLGIAGRLEGEELARSVELVAFTLEEPPFFRTDQMGSAVHARSLAEEGVELLGLINLEMVGFYSDEPDSQEYPLEAMKATYPNQANYIALVGRPEDAELVEALHAVMGESSRLPAVMLLAPAGMTGVDFSDHLNYWALGFTALMVTDTSFYRNENYHTAGDTAETLDYRRMGFVEQGLFEALMWLAAE